MMKVTPHSQLHLVNQIIFNVSLGFIAVNNEEKFTYLDNCDDSFDDLRDAFEKRNEDL